VGAGAEGEGTQDTERAHKAAQIERELEKRQTAKRQAEERRKRDDAKAKAAAERQAKLARTEALKVEAVDRTTQARERIGSLETVLLQRPTGLYRHRTAVENAFNSSGPDGLVEALGGALAELPDTEGLRGEWRAVFAPETRELVIEMDLPGQEVVPVVAQYRFKAAAPAAVVPQPRKEAEVKRQYSRLVARLALRAINEVLAASPPSLVDVVAFNGHVRSKNRATGKAIRPCLVSVRSSRDDFEDLVLDEPALDPVQCLRHLNAIVSQHPYDLEPVRPVVTFDLVGRLRRAAGRSFRGRARSLPMRAGNGPCRGLRGDRGRRHGRAVRAPSRYGPSTPPRTGVCLPRRVRSRCRARLRPPADTGRCRWLRRRMPRREAWCPRGRRSPGRPRPAAER
jgi:hypothetical protein